MKKSILFLFIVLLTSCNSPYYFYENQTNNVGLNFKSGRWLLNNIDCPSEIHDELTKEVYKKFSRHLKKRIDNAVDVKGLMLPKIVAVSPTKTQLAVLKNSTVYDYFINIKGSGINDGNFRPGLPQATDKGTETLSYVIVEIYDLNNLEIIYSRKETGLKRYQKNPSKSHIRSISNQMILKAFHYVWKDLRKKSIK